MCLSINKPHENKIDNTTKFELKGREDCQSTNLSSLRKFGNQQILPQTLLVNVGQNNLGKKTTIRALIDSSSQSRLYTFKKKLCMNWVVFPWV